MFKFVFWQNVLSIHQSNFLSNLSDGYDVTLVVEKEIDESRRTQGWTVPDFGKTNIIIRPSEDKIKELLGSNNIHIFTGINSFALPARVFKKAAKLNVKMGVILEPFNWTGIKGKLRFLKYYYLRFRYQKVIDFVLAIGGTGRLYYEKVGFPKHKIYDWGYFTEPHSVIRQQSTDIDNDAKSARLSKILFVGSIDHNKNILPIVTICLRHQEKIESFKIVGKGVLGPELIKLVAGSKIEYIGTVPNREIGTIMSESDLLILPSLYDGWGAVVNESLCVGTPILISDRCGSAVLIENNRGSIFSVDTKNFEKVFLSTINKLPYSEQERLNIIEWTTKNISGKSASSYFIAIIDNLYGNGKKAMAPWLNK